MWGVGCGEVGEAVSSPYHPITLSPPVSRLLIKTKSLKSLK
ncbi:hypothetical protein MYAER_2584 [Microcystis aeruginosa NIES-2549]|uniref:Uncharacterized protein n=1 Tax=Microcystis aeruginosa NIES-2549 TaxID=1641812 RepID=A0A0F6U599_MICAE|nr:hypothetical protein MYAER_2584 [Microcystis aeruginosa NIES-2549]AOC53326.1 hypothetical protein amyaer_2617 [Microcystis aeruginosa NIES-2481]